MYAPVLDFSILGDGRGGWGPPTSRKFAHPPPPGKIPPKPNFYPAFTKGASPTTE